jgi:RNA polymerase sigma factor (sigma-70 family)
MADTPGCPILRHIRHLIGAGLGGLTDGQLLDRFVACRDEDAVAELVRRHGGLVFGACRRVLADMHAVEDVFQATFLVLVRKAAALDRRRPLGTWLYTVAYRLALTARAEADRRRHREREVARSHPEAVRVDKTNELCLAVEEELQRLPERYRAPLVLCYLEGKTNEQAAQALGWPRGSVSRRMAEARDLLRERLRCRGILRTGAATAVLAGAAQVAPAVPPSLSDHTVRAALWFAAERGTTANILSAGAVRLARKGLRTMAIQKLKIASALLLTAGLLGGGGTFVVRSVLGAPAAPAAAEPAPVATEPRPTGLPTGAAARLGTTLLRHGDTIDFLRFMPDGRQLLTAGKDETLRLWDVASGTELRRFERPEPPRGPAEAGAALDERPGKPGPGGAMRLATADLQRGFRVALSEDGKLLAATRGNAAHVWDAASGRLLHTFQPEKASRLDRLADLTFAADGKSLLTVGGDRTVTTWDLATGKQIGRRDAEASGAGARFRGSLALAPGGRYLAWEEYDAPDQNATLKVQDVSTGAAVGEAKLPVDGARALTFAPDRKTLAWTSFDDGLRLWDCTTAKEPRLFHGEPNARNRPGEVESLVFAADGKTLAACRSDGTARLWDVATGKPICQLGTPPETPAIMRRVVVRVGGGQLNASPVQLAFAPDGKTVATSMGSSLVRRFDAHTGQEIAPPSGGHAGPVTGLAVSVDGTTLTTYARHDVAHVWDLTTGREARQVSLPRDAIHAALAAQGRYLATSGGSTVTVWHLADGKQVARIDPGIGGVTTLAVGPDGKNVATRGQQGRDITLWDRDTGRPRHTLTASADEGGANPTQVLVSSDVSGVLTQDVVFSPDGRYLAGAGPARQLCLWDTATGSIVWEQALLGGQVVEQLAFTGGGRALVAMNRDGTVSLYETATGEVRCRLGRPATARGGPPIAMVGGMPVMLSGFGREGPMPVAMANTPDGRFLAIANQDPVIHLWDVVTGEEVGKLPGHEGGVVSLAFTADGERLISGSLDTTALVWNVGKYFHATTAPEPALKAEDLEAQWVTLAGEDAGRAFTAMRQLCRHPAQTANLARQRLRAAEAPDAGRLARLVADLDSPEFTTRQKATADLGALGEQARPALEKALVGEASLEVRQRVERLLQKLAGKPSGDRLRELRVVEALELAGGLEARQGLEALAGGAPDARLTREARAALQRLRR